jgi:hypothetical protein
MTRGRRLDPEGCVKRITLGVKEGKSLAAPKFVPQSGGDPRCRAADRRAREGGGVYANGYYSRQKVDGAGWVTWKTRKARGRLGG